MMLVHHLGGSGDPQLGTALRLLCAPCLVAVHISHRSRGLHQLQHISSTAGSSLTHHAGPLLLRQASPPAHSIFS